MGVWDAIEQLMKHHYFIFLRIQMVHEPDHPGMLLQNIDKDLTKTVNLKIWCKRSYFLYSYCYRIMLV